MPDNQPVHLLHPELQSLLVHWFLASGGRAMPRKRDLPMRALEAWSGNIAMIVPNAHGEAGRFQFPWCGEALAARFGRGMNGHPLRDMDAAQRLAVRRTLEGVCRAAAPALARAEIANGDGTVAVWCDLVLPLADGGARPTRLLFASYAPKAASPLIVAFAAAVKRELQRAAR